MSPDIFKGPSPDLTIAEFLDQVEVCFHPLKPLYSSSDELLLKAQLIFLAKHLAGSAKEWWRNGDPELYKT